MYIAEELFPQHKLPHYDACVGELKIEHDDGKQMKRVN